MDSSSVGTGHSQHATAHKWSRFAERLQTPNRRPLLQLDIIPLSTRVVSAIPEEDEGASLCAVQECERTLANVSFDTTLASCHLEEELPTRLGVWCVPAEPVAVAVSFADGHVSGQLCASLCFAVAEHVVTLPYVPFGPAGLSNPRAAAPLPILLTGHTAGPP